MLYREVAPSKDLASMIECFWLLEHDYRADFHTHEHLWANAHSELIFTFGERYYLKTKAGKRVLPENFLIGPFKKKLMLYSDGFTGFVAIRFKPWGIFPLSKKPIRTLVGKIVSAEEIFGDEIKSLITRLKGRNRKEKIELAQKHFQRELSAICGAKIASVPIAERIISEKGIVQISQLAKQFEINSRQLERVFRAETGLSAKMFSRIIRFNQAKGMIESDPDISLSRLTYEMGYSDQAHFSKNFRELFDYSPADFKRKLKRFSQEASGLFDVEFLQDR